MSRSDLLGKLSIRIAECVRLQKENDELRTEIAVLKAKPVARQPPPGAGKFLERSQPPEKEPE